MGHPAALSAAPTAAELAAFAAACFKAHRWDDLLAAAQGQPFDATGPRGDFWDAVCFAHTQRGQLDEALALGRQLQAARTRRRDVSLAYVCYLALLSGAELKGATRDELKRDFLALTARVLEAEPGHVTALYRLGNFYAEIESARDKKALEVFLRAIAVYERLDPEARRRDHRFFKPYVKALYGGARSALRLERWDWAQYLSARCLRLDAESNFLAPMFKLYQAACALAGSGQYARAEKGLRLALEAKGPRDRAFIHDRLALARAAQDDVPGAIAWLEQHVPAHHRPSYIWVHLGDLQYARGRPAAARLAWESSLRGDRVARHLALCRLGELALAEGRLGQAKAHFTEALTFRRKRHQATEPRALRGLLALAQRDGDAAEVARLTAELARTSREPVPPADDGSRHVA
jgi:tetratricopeptide (TPR) repeat protein